MTLKYLSPSSFKEAKLCTAKFFDKRLAGLERIQEPRSYPAMVGTWFDWFVKKYLCKHYQWPIPLMDDELKDDQQSEAYFKGLEIFRRYVECGAADDLVREGVANILQDVTKDHGDFILRGIPDLMMQDATICDLKTRGFKSQASPTQGYCKYYDGYSLTTKEHPRRNEPLENLHEDWAAQLTIYTWNLLGIKRHPNGKPFMTTIKVGIDEATQSSKGEIIFAKIRTHITPEFQHTLFDDLKSTWDYLNNLKERPVAIPGKFKCNAFGVDCPVKDNCPEYQSLKNDSSRFVTPEWVK